MAILNQLHYGGKKLSKSKDKTKHIKFHHNTQLGYFEHYLPLRKIKQQKYGQQSRILKEIMRS